MRLSLPKNPYLALTYDSSPHADGIGAQAERILSIYWWATRVNIGYLHSGITDLVEPYSNTWTMKEHKAQLLGRINNKISLNDTTESEFDSIRAYRKLTRRTTALKYLESLVTRKRILLKVLYVPRAHYKKNFFNQVDEKLQIKSTKKNIVVHIRNAEGRYGVEDRRNLKFDYYIELLDLFRKQLDKSQVNYSIKILTDIGKSDFELIISQIPKDKLWIYSLTEDQLQRPSILFKGKDYKELYFKGDDNVVVIQGGDPLEALEIMEKADYLIMSRSSLSSVGGTLNRNGLVIQPPDWIYARNEKWVKARKVIKIRKEWRVARHPLLYLFIPHAAMNWLKRRRVNLARHFVKMKY